MIPKTNKRNAIRHMSPREMANKDKKPIANKRKKEWEKPKKNVGRDKPNVWTDRHSVSHRVEHYEEDTYTYKVYIKYGKVSFCDAETIALNSPDTPYYENYGDVDFDVKYDPKTNKTTIKGSYKILP